MKRIMKHVKKYWYYYLIGIGLLLISVVLDFITPVMIGRIIDEVVVAGDYTIFGTLIGIMVIITVARTVLGYFKELAFDIAGVNVVCDIRQQLFDHIQSLSKNFFEATSTGELMARVKEDAEKIEYGISFGIMLAIEMSITFVVAVVLMISISLKLSLLMLVVVPILGFIAVKLERTANKLFGEISEQNAKLNTVAQENLSGVRLVKAFTKEEHEIEKFMEQNKGYYELNVKQIKLWGNYFPPIQFLTVLLPLLVVVIGGAFVVGETLTIGTLARYTQYTYMVIWPMRMVGWLSSLLAESSASAKKINKIFDEKPEVTNKEDAIIVNKLDGNISFENVTVTFDEKDILKDISFKVEPGNTLAIMGAAGSGKSSVVNLLMRGFDKTKGKIRLDGHEIEDLQLQSLRKNISVVMQETFLFSDTIEENIKLGMGNTEEVSGNERMESASKMAQAHDFVSRMDEDYKTIIGEKGIGLSGGQKQRISIARAIAKDASILIFDDSTSALDMHTEEKVQEEIKKLENVTKIIIAHRVSSVRTADEIIILDQGQVVERGNHNELMNQQGRYYETFIEQYQV